MALRIVRLAIVGVGLLAIAMIVRTSFDPASYFYYRDQDRSSWDHPTSDVVFIATAALLETALLYGTLAVKKPGRVWIRALIGLAIITPWEWWVGEFVVHAPGYRLMHLVWVWLIMVVLVVAVTASGALHAYSLLRERAL